MCERAERAGKFAEETFSRRKRVAAACRLVLYGLDG